MRRLIHFSALAIALTAAVARAQTGDLDEETFGDFSGNVNSPTTAEFFHGVHTVTATFGAGDYDLLAVTIPADHHLDGITLLSYTGPSQSFFAVQASSTWTAGLGGTVDPTKLLGWTHYGPAADGAHVGDDLLDNLAVPAQGSSGFTIPLGPGVYTFLFQELSEPQSASMLFNVGIGGFIEPGDFNADEVVDGDDLAQWKIDFGKNGFSDGDNDGDSDGNDIRIWQQHLLPDPIVAAVPEPATIVLGAMAIVALICRR